MRTKPNRMYHSAWNKYGDVLSVNDKWVTCRFDGEKGSCCYEVDAPYIKMLILEENPKPDPIRELEREIRQLEVAVYDLKTENNLLHEALDQVIEDRDSYHNDISTTE
jgi:hypothetical protein